MKFFILALLLGVSCGSMAQVAPVSTASLPRVGVHQTDMSKLKFMHKEVVDEKEDAMDIEVKNSARRYKGVATNENVESVARMARLMQDDPEQFIRQGFLGGDQSVDLPEMSRIATGTDKEVPPYEMLVMGDDPVENMANIKMPILTGSEVELASGRDEIREQYVKARKQIEQMGRQHLGQKAVPIQMP